jgi:hypothetical protein
MDERSRRIAQSFEVPILIAALLVIPLIVIEESNVSDTSDGFSLRGGRDLGRRLELGYLDYVRVGDGGPPTQRE